MKLTELALLSLQTAFMQRDLTTQGFCKGLDIELRDTAVKTYNLLMYQTIDTLQDNEFGNSMIDELAWQFHVDYYDHTASFDVRRDLVKQSIRIHRKKGTPQAIEDLINTAFPTQHTILSEWFDYGGDPYHFKITTTKALSAQEEENFLKALNTVKNARSYFDGIETFSLILHNAISNISTSVEIEYTLNFVEPQAEMPYGFGNGQTLAFGDNEYGFLE